MVVDALDALERQLDECRTADVARLSRRLSGLRRRLGRGQPIDRGLTGLAAAIEASRAARAARLARLPRPDYPAGLPVVEHRVAIAEAIARHPVVIVCGETGSGKTTQLPKICLELGRGAAGLIGHTQPRRIAARSLAARIAEELGVPLGGPVGYKVRFSDRVGTETAVKVMTDGILLAETRGDPDLRAYDTLIIDEAHERSLNIDFLLGYLRRLLPRRPDLRVVITSATIDTERFSRHFDDAPVIEVSGRGYPVEIRYRPLRGEDEAAQDRDREQALLDAVDELAAEGPGDMLVFLPGEREIREAAELLCKHHPPETEILPLYGRLSAAQQNRVFQTHGGRRIVLATNVAETSLTVPGIRYVIDTGLARISRYAWRSKVQRLPVEPVSRASADQRAGRCGRTGPGICIRLYDEADYLARPRFTDPEILRTNLAAVILQMLALRLGEVDDFPFLDRPDPRHVRAGFRLLQELGAVDARHRITELGQRLARLPVDPRIGRMLLAAGEEGSLREVLVIAAALSVPDPRERPLDKAQAADERHALFADERSDFLGFVRLWTAYREQRRRLSRNRLRDWCRQHFLSVVRMREWHDIHQQLLALVHDMGLRPNSDEASYEAVHRALLAGLLGQVAFRSDASEYTGARDLRLQMFPGSVLFRRRPKWILAAELVETGRRYARICAMIEPQWVESLAGPLLKRHHADPHWENRGGRVVALEQVSLYGLVLARNRRVDYGRIDPAAAREIFIREALVRGDLDSRLPFVAHNRELLREIEGLEARSRRRDVLVDEALLARWFDERLPQAVRDRRTLERWWRRAGEAERARLFLDRDTLMQHGAAGITETRFPTRFATGGLSLALSYRFEPGHADDGVTLEIPLAALGQLRAEIFEWLVPGLIEDKVTALIRGLPKPLRRHFVPAPDYARAALEALLPAQGSLFERLSQQLARMTGVEVPAEAWAAVELPAHLRMNFRLVDADGGVLAQGRDLAALQQAWQDRASAAFSGLPASGLERADVQDWDFGTLPEVIEREQAGLRLRAWPALVPSEDGSRIELRLLDRAEAARRAHGAGVAALFRRRAARAVRHLERNLPRIDRLCLDFAPLGRCEQLRADLVARVIELALPEAADIRDAEAFEAARARAEPALMGLAQRLCEPLADVLARHRALGRQLKGSLPPAWLAAVSDIRDQLQWLVQPRLARDLPVEIIESLPRWLAAVERRLQRLAQDPARDRRDMAAVEPWWARARERLARDPHALEDADFARYRWLVEEYRVSLFAQELGTREKVSPQRLERAWRALSPA
ncbi:ATP-dependent RNA helicase HrpA [Thiohalobacter sp.]|uniref:ATP-dependent RNA helicase HrpA n=1 Tax=Thiohalobacter sp. TaxID=2025948 RepID=UPI0026019F9B|nr:ATP-dependent RNA helicase HrpA [Thiohalobacter sp.]